MQECKGIQGEKPTVSRRWDGRRRKGGVSDIIGTILILAITVTLFSSIFFFVSNLPGPPPSNTSQFTAGIVAPTGGGTQANVSITYTNGPVLVGAGGTDIYLKSQVNPALFACKDPYDISIGLPGQTTWSAGQTWTIPLNGTTTCSGTGRALSGDNLTIEIVNPVKNLVIFDITLPGTISNIPPEFISEGFLPSPNVKNTGPFSLWAQIRDDDLRANSVYANLSVIPGTITGNGFIPKCSCIKMYYSPTLGEWNTSNLTTSSSSVIGNSFPVTLNATDKMGQVNSVVIYVSFATPQGGAANLQVTLSASPGNPIIHQNTTITATIADTGAVGGPTEVTFTANYGNFCPSVTRACPSPGPKTFSVNTTVPAYGSGIIVSAYWNATGANSIGDGVATITASVSLTSSYIAPLTITVYPNTVLIDGTGVAQGSTSPVDPFTYLTTDFNSADIPYTTIVATPGSSTITYSGSGSTALQKYNVVVWDVGNASSTSVTSNTCLSSTDATSLNTAITKGVAVWMMGGDAFSCTGAGQYASTYTPAFGISSGGQLSTTSPVSVSPNLAGNVPVLNYPSTVYQGAGSYYSALTLGAATSYLVAGGNSIATGYNPGGGNGPTFATSFDLATVDTLVTYPGGSAYAPGTGPQASIVYDVFDFLASFTQGSNPPTNVHYGTDWAVSQVVVNPSSVSFMSKTFINVVVRNNGIYQTPIAAELLIDGMPYPSSAPLTVVLNPAPLGGSSAGTITWLPPTVGFVTVGAQIVPPTNDSNPGNNVLYNSLFNTQTYVGYSVLVVDGALHHAASLPDVTNTTIIPSLVAAGYNRSTINVTYLGALGCGTLGVSLSNFNLVVWNIGVVTNTSGQCPLSNSNLNVLSSFLVNGGLKSSLLFLGPGLMTEASDANVATFAQTYLGTSVTNTSKTSGGYVSTVFGSTTDPVGNGLDIPYAYGNPANFNYTCLPSGAGAASLFYNLTANHADYWSGQTFCAGTSTLGSNGWHSAYWAFNMVSAGMSSQLSLAFLRVSTFSGRLLPNSDTVVSPPDVTFAQVANTWTSFPHMHPQLQQQYLVQANITNLGGITANNVGISIFDGAHILGSQTLTIGGSTTSISGQSTLGVGKLSVPWTPLYAGSNEITVQITSSTAGQILPGVAHIARYNITVYFFYDATKDNSNSWTHSQLYLQQTGFAPTCSPSPVGTQIFPWDDMSVPKQWPSLGSACNPAAPSAGTWGVERTSGLCYDLQEGGCSSLAILDSVAGTGCSGFGWSNNYCGYVSWKFSSPIAVPLLSSGLTSATLTWEQKFALAQYANGGVVCITTNPANLPNGGYGSGALEAMASCDGTTPSPTPTDSQTTIAVLSSAQNPGPCQIITAFTGSSGGGTFAWQQETLNLTQYQGTTIYVAFGLVQGGYDSCLSLTGTPPTYPSGGWYIDDFRVSYGSQSSSPAYTSGGSGVPSDLWGLYSGGALSTSLTQMGTGAPPTGSAWVSAAWDSGTTVFDANMWDSLYSRPIDLSSAINANLTFNYAFSNVLWVTQAAGLVCYIYTQDPSQGMVLEIAQANTQNWVTVWSANGAYYGGAGNCNTWTPPNTVGNTYSSYNYYEYSGYTAANIASVTTWGWRPAYLNLNGYVGQVIQLRFLVGTNNGGNGAYTGESQDTNVCYPMTTYTSASCNPANPPLASGGMVSGIFITGNTSIAPGTGPNVLQGPLSSTPMHAQNTLHASPAEGASAMFNMAAMAQVDFGPTWHGNGQFIVARWELGLRALVG